MKLLLAFIQKEDAPHLLRRLREENIVVTTIGSSGGFLRRRNVTLLTALPDEQLDSVLAQIQEMCHARMERVDTTFATGDVESVGLPTPAEVPVGGATVVVLDVAQMVRV